ncbi:fibrillin-1-like [Pecten maximus]|uniref:fibrillin-1-like n=1 Tax=Pecten maximus TaxID=6579 RepID=UPI001458DB7F|nr:fibrillin-1-like [Pecten maximus]
MTCKENEIYRHTADGYQETCLDAKDTPEYISELPVADTCVCKEGYVLDDKACVEPKDCGCSFNEKYFKIGDVFVTDDCTKKYMCQRNGTESATMTLQNESDGCGNNAVCVTKERTKQCDCLPGYQRNGKHCEKSTEEGCRKNEERVKGKCVCQEGFQLDKKGKCTEKKPAYVCPSGAMENTIICSEGTCAIGDGYTIVQNVAPVMTGDKDECFKAAWFKVSQSSITILQTGCGSEFVVCYKQTKFSCPSGAMDETMHCEKGTCSVKDGNVELIKVYAPITGTTESCFESDWYDNNKNSISIIQEGCGSVFQVCYKQKKVECSSTQTISCYGKIGQKIACPMNGQGRILDINVPYSWSRSDSSKPCDKAMIRFDEKNIWISEGCMSADVEACIGEAVCTPECGFNAKCDDGRCRCPEGMSGNPIKECYVNDPTKQCPYSVTITNKLSSRRNGGAFAHSVAMEIYGYTIELLQKKRVKVNDKLVTLPYRAQSGKVYITRRGSHVNVVAPECGIEVSFNGRKNAVVQVPKNKANDLNGICGDCTNLRNDDYIVRNSAEISKYRVYDPSDSLTNAQCLVPVSPCPPRFKNIINRLACTNCGVNMEYRDTVVGCQPTCGAPPPEETCTPPYEGCVCKAGYLLSGDKCIKESECGCLMHDGTHIRIGDPIVQDCSGTYECIDDNGKPFLKYSPGGSACIASAKCVNTDGNFKCQCPVGFKGDGVKSCDDINECELGTADCSIDNSECFNTPGTYRCECVDGYKMVNGACEDINECSQDENACPENAECTNETPGFSCKCKDGFKMKGQICEGK